MRDHLQYLSYVVRHKYFVLLASRKTGCGLLRALLHDWSKFLPDEWGPYVRCFYAPDGTKRYVDSDEFSVAWLKHQHRNPHHWQHWVILFDDNVGPTPLRMTDPAVAELVADWMGACLAQGKPDIMGWYRENSAKMVLHPETRAAIERLLEGVVGNG